MSIEFKMSGRGNGKRSRLYKRTNRAALNKIDAPHLPMRIHSGKGGYWGQTSTHFAYPSYKKISKFLMERVGKPVNIVFSEFLSEMKKFRQKEDLKELFYSHIDYERDKMRFGRGEGFYVSNGILNYRNDYMKNQKTPKKFINYNLSHFNKELLNFKSESVGPVPIGKLWVCIGGQYMLLPIYVVGEEKWDRSRGETNPMKFLYRACKKSELLYLKDFTRVTVCGLGGHYSIANNGSPRYYADYNYYPYIVRVSDIENYKKEKFPKEKVV